MMSLSQSDTPLLNALKAAVARPHAPFYTPGHKRGQGIMDEFKELLGEAVFRADLPELPGLDNLFSPQGAIAQAQELAAAAFGADQTWFLANGSTSGIIAGILATCGPGDKILLPRNSHQSVLSGLILSGAMPVWLEPDYDAERDLVHGITPAGVKAALEIHPDAKAVLMVYPTYYGVCGDIQAIAQLAHRYHIPLLVDEAHGAHFAFHPDLPLSALSAGADLTVQSTHKTLSGMTQAAMVHLQGDRIDPGRISQALQLVQSTSPSYLLLASLDAACAQMATQGHALMTHTLALAEQARSQLAAIPGLTVLDSDLAGQSPGFAQLDPTRLTVTVTGLGYSGFAVDEILHEQWGVTAEFPSLRHLTFIISLGNTTDDVTRLVQALAQLPPCDDRPSLPYWSGRLAAPPTLSPLSPRAAFFAPTETLPMAETVGRLSAEWVCPYPPGIPILLPGEAIAPEALAYLDQVMMGGGWISGCADPSLQTLRVIKP